MADLREGVWRLADPNALAALVADYAVVLAELPRVVRGPVRALLGLHEVENLKLAWRGLAKGLPWERWSPAWRPLGALATLRPEDWREVGTLREALGPLVRTPCEEIGTAMLRAHATGAARRRRSTSPGACWRSCRRRS